MRSGTNIETIESTQKVRINTPTEELINSQNVQLRMQQQSYQKLMHQLQQMSRQSAQNQLGGAPSSMLLRQPYLQYNSLYQPQSLQRSLYRGPFIPHQISTESNDQQQNYRIFSSEMSQNDFSPMPYQMQQMVPKSSYSHQEQQQQHLLSISQLNNNYQHFQVAPRIDSMRTLKSENQKEEVSLLECHQKIGIQDLTRSEGKIGLSQDQQNHQQVKPRASPACPQLPTVLSIASQQQIPSNKYIKFNPSMISQNKDQSELSDQKIAIIRAALGTHLSQKQEKCLNSVGIIGAFQAKNYSKKPFAASCTTPFQNEVSTHCSITGTHTPNLALQGIGSQPIFNINSAVAYKNAYGELCQPPFLNSNGFYVHQNGFHVHNHQQVSNFQNIGRCNIGPLSNFGAQVTFNGQSINHSQHYASSHSNDDASLEQSMIAQQANLVAQGKHLNETKQLSPAYGIGNGGISPIEQQVIIQQEQTQTQQVQSFAPRLQLSSLLEIGKQTRQDIKDSNSKEENKSNLDVSISIQSSSKILEPETESLFSSQAQKRRKIMAEAILNKNQEEILIEPAEKQHRGPQIKLHISKKGGSNSLKDQRQRHSVNSQQLFRGSRFRGISKNGGSSWQILVMVNRQKKYLGSLQSEEEAAQLYDKVVIQQQGLKAKTNFAYKRNQLIKILMLKPLV